MDTESDDEYQPASQSDDSSPSPQLKTYPIRARTPVRETSSRKRPREQNTTISGALLPAPPLKRQRGNFSIAYLNLLNQDIQDASAGQILQDRSRNSRAPPPLQPTQIGAISWTADEKEALFTAIARVGRDDLSGIAARIGGSKSELEIRQYLLLLSVAERSRRADEGKRHRALRPVDVPAAVEVGTECGVALELIADGLSLRQEAYEEGLEQNRWGSRWLITAPLAQVLEHRYHQQQQHAHQTEEDEEQGRSEQLQLQSQPQSQLPSHSQGQRQTEQPQGSHDEEQSGQADVPYQGRSVEDLPFLQLFPIRNWLRLSDGILMNSSIPDGNWRNISAINEPPAVRATAFADFHALTISITRRLISATIYVAESRIRAKDLGDPRRHARRLVWPKDVKAAVASLGMKEDSKRFWACCARRLRLDVVDDEAEEWDDKMGTDNEDDDSSMRGDEKTDADRPQDLDHADDLYEIMTYDQVETALGFPAPETQKADEEATTTYNDLSSLSDSSLLSSSSDETEDREMPDQGAQIYSSDSDQDSDIDPTAISADLEEALTHGPTVDHTGTTRARQALRSRIRTEHILERDAERQDVLASADAEEELWALLRGESLDSRTGKRDRHTMKRSASRGSMYLTTEEEYEDEPEIKGEPTTGDEGVNSNEENPRARVRQSGLVDLAPNWREKIRYASEWENALKRQDE
ncbi:hypothetical protein F5Y16DRAFT_21494 [Xylariaceae sp. FL0255]|nr:hypothetical protein F5Y16DRAFT_21494 [Xylariaceae sp. FL0255]